MGAVFQRCNVEQALFFFFFQSEGTKTESAWGIQEINIRDKKSKGASMSSMGLGGRGMCGQGLGGRGAQMKASRSQQVLWVIVDCYICCCLQGILVLFGLTELRAPCTWHNLIPQCRREKVPKVLLGWTSTGFLALQP